jgi:hypothetical protein
MATWSITISNNRIGDDLLGIFASRLSSGEVKRAHRPVEEQLLGDERLIASPSQVVERRIMRRCTNASLSSLRSTTPYKGRSLG